MTWMDVRIGEILPTPRHGKPVEINAYWYNALRIMDFFSNRLKGELPADPEFQPFYGGEQLKRDLAYHQGTVWTYPLGGYYLVYLKVNDYSEEAKAHVRAQIESITAALREGCIGQLPEIYDGGHPVSSKGCFAQAWSVGEILRVYEALEIA